MKQNRELENALLRFLQKNLTDDSGRSDSEQKKEYHLKFLPEPNFAVITYYGSIDEYTLVNDVINKLIREENPFLSLFIPINVNFNFKTVLFGEQELKMGWFTILLRVYN